MKYSLLSVMAWVSDVLDDDNPFSFFISLSNMTLLALHDDAKSIRHRISNILKYLFIVCVLEYS